MQKKHKKLHTNSTKKIGTGRKTRKSAKKENKIKNKNAKKGKANGEKKEKIRSIYNKMSLAIDAKIIDDAINDGVFTNYVVNNVGKKSIDVLKALSTPKTDEKLAEDLGIRINEVRRMLNMLNADGVVRYIVNRDSKGWLTFRWYIDQNKLSEIRNKLALENIIENTKIEEDTCNDFFYCEPCFRKQRIILPFETAVEMNFRCENGHMLKRIDKSDVERLLNGDYATAES